MAQCGAMLGGGFLGLSQLRAGALRCECVWLGILAFAVCSLTAVQALGAEGSVTAPPAAAPYLILDGKTFRAQAFQGGTKIFEDQLVFEDGDTVYGVNHRGVQWMKRF